MIGDELTGDDWAAVLKLAVPESPAAGYLYDPVGWCDRFLTGFTPKSYQRDAMTNLVEYHREVIYGPHGLGKTDGIASPVIAWFASTREAARVEWLILTTASVGRQLSKALWPGVHRIVKKMDFEELNMPPWRPKKELLDVALKLNYGHAYAAASDDADKLESAHARSLLVVFDEAKAIPEEAWNAIEGAFINAGEDTDFEAYALALSTPGGKDSQLYKIAMQEKGFRDWHVRPVTLQETIEESQTSVEWAENRLLQWGEKSAVYINKVLGEFASETSEGFLPYEWIEAAHIRWHKLRKQIEDWDGPLTIGLDPARQGQDSTVKTRYIPHLNAVKDIIVEDQTDNLALLGRETAHETRSGILIVDSGGLGAGVYDAARRTAVCRCVNFQPAGKTPWTDTSGLLSAENKRTAAYLNLREQLNPELDATLALPEDEELVGEILAQRVVDPTKDRWRLQKKEHVKARIKRSPDKSDSLTYAKWQDPPTIRKPRSRSVVAAAQLGWSEYGR